MTRPEERTGMPLEWGRKEDMHSFTGPAIELCNSLPTINNFVLNL
jgi:hypothetical protein